jgi:hypothetical protein
MAACTKDNPAYRINGATEDAASEENPPPGGLPDTAVVVPLDGPRLVEDGPAAAEDVALEPEVAVVPPDVAVLPPDAALAPPDLPPVAPDVAPDLRPPVDLAPDLAADSGVSNSGIVAHWRLDEGTGSAIADSTPNGNAGATKGGATWVMGGFPNAKFANPWSLRLDGQDDYVEITNKNIPGSAAPKTLAAWFKATAPDAIPIRNLVALINETSDAGIQMGLDQGRVAAWFFGDLAPRVWAVAKVDSNWHHAAYTFDGKTHRIYYDGKIEMSKDITPLSGTITRTRLGTWKAPEEMFQGQLDDVRIYARALSDAEVMLLWSGQ